MYIQEHFSHFLNIKISVLEMIEPGSIGFHFEKTILPLNIFDLRNSEVEIHGENERNLKNWFSLNNLDNFIKKN